MVFIVRLGKQFIVNSIRWTSMRFEALCYYYYY